MKNKKLVILLFSIIVLVVFIFNYYGKSFENNEIIKSENLKVDTNNMISFMYETDSNSGEYIVSNDSSWISDGYQYNASLSKCKNGSTISYNSTNNSIKIKATKNDFCYVYFDKKSMLFSDYIINTYGTDENLYYHDENLINSAGDNSYRYSGADPNNYVYIEGAGELLTMRIIGVFNGQVKLIFDDFVYSEIMNDIGITEGVDYNLKAISTYKGSMSSTKAVVWGNTVPWSESIVYNEMNLYLNEIFLDGNIDFIDLHEWVMAQGEAGDVLANARTAYDFELGDYASTATVDGHFGLMYVNEYAYAASPTYWPQNVYSNYSSATTNNWMYMGVNEWTMTVNTEDQNDAFVLFSDGNVNSEIAAGDGSGITVPYPIRPTFYLKSNVEFLGGKGTYSEPYII